MSKRDPIALYYSGEQRGAGSLPYFVGNQYGSGWLRTLARIAFPLLQTVVGAAGNVAARTAKDLIDEKKTFKDSLRDNALGEVSNLIGGQKRPAPTSLPSSINTLKKKKKFKRHHTIFAK